MRPFRAAVDSKLNVAFSGCTTLSPEKARRHRHRAAGKGGFSGALRFVTYLLISNASNFGMKLHVVVISGDLAQGGVPRRRGRRHQMHRLYLRDSRARWRDGLPGLKPTVESCWRCCDVTPASTSKHNNDTQFGSG
jgi:hypothetical protein